MAEFTALRRVKPMFIVDEMSIGFESKDFIGATVYGGRNRRGLRVTDVQKRKITRLSNYDHNRTSRRLGFSRHRRLGATRITRKAKKRKRRLIRKLFMMNGWEKVHPKRH